MISIFCERINVWTNSRPTKTLTFNDFDWSPDNLVTVYLLFHRRRVYIFISFAWQLQWALSQVCTIGLVFIVHGQIVLLTMSLWTLH